jgi:ribose transport system substrate-binding protein
MSHRNARKAWLMLGAAITLVAGCAESGDAKRNGAGTGPKDAKVTLIDIGAKNPFYLSLNCGASQKAKDLGIDLIVTQPKDGAKGPEAQLPAIRAALARQPDVVILGPADRVALTPTLQRAMKDGVKVITVDQSLDDPAGVTAQVATDQHALGVRAAKLMAEKLGGTGKAVVLTAPPGFPALDQRTAGFTEGLKGTGVELKTVLRDTTFSPKGAASQVRGAVAGDPEVRGFYATYGAQAVGAASVARAGDKLDDWTIIATDQEKPVVEELKSGTIDAIMGQDPAKVGAEGVQQAYNAVTGANVTAQVTVNPIVITADNVGSIKPYLTKAQCG